GKISISTYFTQVKRVQQFLLNNTSLTEPEIFEMEIKKRKKQYTTPKLITEKPSKLSDVDLDNLILTIYKQLSKVGEKLEVNPIIESMFAKNFVEQFGRQLSDDLNQEIINLINSDYEFEHIDQKYLQLGQLYLQVGKTLKAKEAFNKISTPTLKYSTLTQLAVLENDFDLFKKYIQQAFPETFEPVTYGPYILAFLIGNKWNYRYELDNTGNRCISLVLSNGIIQITHLDILRVFVRYVRFSSDGRIGIWVRPNKSEHGFRTNNITNLTFKVVLGWRDIYVYSID
ncbi:MAG: hypothetical protein ACW97X_00375, partial [Candidatus Hodarchaeales archaeon]